MMIYVFHLLIFCFLVLGLFFYRLARKTFTIYYWNKSYSNTINLEIIVREICNKACIIAIMINRFSKLTDEEKENKIVEDACSITADVLLQHNIEPKNYDLISLIKVEIFKINLSIKRG